MRTSDFTTSRTKCGDADSKRVAIAGVPCFADTFVQGGSSVLRMKFSAKTPPPSPPETLAVMLKHSNEIAVDEKQKPKLK